MYDFSYPFSSTNSSVLSVPDRIFSLYYLRLLAASDKHNSQQIKTQEACPWPWGHPELRTWTPAGPWFLFFLCVCFIAFYHIGTFSSGSILTITVLGFCPHWLRAREGKKALPSQLNLGKSKGKTDRPAWGHAFISAIINPCAQGSGTMEVQASLTCSSLWPCQWNVMRHGSQRSHRWAHGEVDPRGTVMLWVGNKRRRWVHKYA